MASLKAIAAIAITLMIAVPIGMGYATASTEETVTNYETDGTANVTDLLLNSEAEYYEQYINPMNNKMLLYDGTDGGVYSPDYVSESSTVTSTPVFTTVETQYGLPAATTGTLTITGDSTFGYITSDDLPPRAVIKLYGSTVGGNLYSLTDSNGHTQTGIFQKVYFVRDGSSTYTVWGFASTDAIRPSTFHDIASWKIGGAVGATFAYNFIDYTTVTINDSTYYMPLTYAGVKLTDSNSTDYYIAGEALDMLYKTSATSYLCNGVTYTNISTIQIADSPSISYYSEQPSGTYGDPSAGWYADPAPTENFSGEIYWFNNQANKSIRLMLDIPTGTTVDLGNNDDDLDSATIHIMRDSNGVLSIKGRGDQSYITVGSYEYAMLVMNTRTATVYGLAGWPSLGTYPETLNYVTVNNFWGYTPQEPTFEKVHIVESTGTVAFRVDSVEVLAGTYPITEDLLWGASNYYPDSAYIFTVKSVATYGDSITVYDGSGTLSRVLTVSDGTATFTDEDGKNHSIKVRGLGVTVEMNNDSTWNVVIGNHTLFSNLTYAPYFGFDGTWSLTASVTTLTQTTSTQQVWAPGEFAFDKEDFAACGLLVAGACLIGLGMHGNRSGTKMGLLLIICGGAGLIYLTIL